VCKYIAHIRRTFAPVIRHQPFPTAANGTAEMPKEAVTKTETKIFFIIALAALLFGCGQTPQNQTLTYDNFVVYSDLSSRLTNKPAPNDLALIDAMLDYFKNECVKPGKKMNDYSAITLDKLFHNDNSVCCPATIDVGAIKPLATKQAFVNKELDASIDAFRSVAKCIYSSDNKGGIDLLTQLYCRIKDGNNLKTDETLPNGKDTVIRRYNNNVVILTDGYLEFVGKNDYNKGFYFSVNEIQAIRNYCIAKNLTSAAQALSESNTLPRLQALKCANNKIVNLFILETADRHRFSSAKSGAAKYPTGLSDNEILRDVWELWAKESGFKSFHWQESRAKESEYNADYLKKIFAK